MSDRLASYNGYQFNSYSDIRVSANAVMDDAGRTVLYHQYKIRIESVIYAQDEDNAGEAGEHFRRIRSKLLKQGQELRIYHKGFDTDGLFVVNANGSNDVKFGPKPSVVTWEPVGYENAVHVVWECEANVTGCLQSKRSTGLMALNYSMTTKVNQSGYTTRTTSGYLAIAMTRDGRNIPDTADAYRDAIKIPKPPNYQRETTWNLSLDKTRADFTITDTEIESPNAFPPGVVKISGNHLLTWSRRQMSSLPQTIRTTIELAAGQPRSRAWEIFRSIVESRLRYSGTITRILEGLAVEEELFGNTFTFSASYRFTVDPMNSILDALPGWYTSAGIGQPLNSGRWETWSESLDSLQSHRGLSGLTHDPGSDQIIDMCSETFIPEVVDETARVFYAPPASTGRPISNRKPTPSKSYIRFDTFLETTENVPTTVQVAVAPDDLVGQAFDPKNPEATLGGTSSAGREVDRFVETQSGRIEFVWRGYAERVGYPIPRPDKLKVGGYELRRTGRGSFLQGLIGNMLGQAVYAAAWAQRYVVSKRPKNLTGLNGFNDPNQ